MSIIITQVGEGSVGSDKYIEISNTGSGNVDVSGYRIGLSSNGEGTAIGDLTLTTLTNVMGGATVLAPGETIVIYNGSSSAALITAAGAATHSGSGAISHNGNDAYILFDGTDAIIDSVGDADSSANDATMNANLSRVDQTPDVTPNDAVNTTTQWSETPYVSGDPGDLGMVCFAKGTQISTADGVVAVEALKIGDFVQTAAGTTTKVLWIGRQTVKTAIAEPKNQPVRINAGALGDGLPTQDLTVTANHGMVIDGLVINASALVNGSTIEWVPASELADHVTYYHVETETHDVIFANGAPSETFVDAVGRAAFDNHQEYLDLHSVERIIPEMSQMRICSQRLLPDALKRRFMLVDPSDDAAADMDQFLGKHSKAG
ncbi:MAG: Hint domain-containing protein [Sulfitobacter sp.]